MCARMLMLAGLVGLFAPAARADVKPHPLFTDNMVLQRDAALTVWGKADPGEKVTVTLTPANGAAAEATATADPDGNWKATLPKQKAGTGFTLGIKGKNAVELKNVAVGDVWLCTGQSNMQWEMWRLTKDEQGKKVSARADHPALRLFTFQRRPSAKPETDIPVTTATRKEGDKEYKAEFGKWQECTPDALYEFSAVGYYFGRDLQKAENVPIGLLATNWGGTSAQSWTSREALEAVPELKYYVEQFDAAVKAFDLEKAKAANERALAKYKDDAAKAKAEGKPAPRPPALQSAPGTYPFTTTLYNGMIAPLLHFPVKGAIWYQGESNASRAYEYATLLSTMIQDWRKRWGSDFTFLIVQLAPFKGGPSGVDYAELRDAQYQVTKRLPKVGLAVITDAGDETDIHPQQKEPVGARLALAARAIAYGEKVEYSGPVYKDAKIEGDKVVLTFDHVGRGLTKKGEELTGFTVCGEDKVFHPAKAEIKGDTVVVSSDRVSKPVAVRFGWVNFARPELNFFNKDGLPAVPFRTDDFPLTTQPKK